MQSEELWKVHAESGEEKGKPPMGEDIRRYFAAP
jgi:hypothetical protein